jgi:hypothetical protein
MTIKPTVLKKNSEQKAMMAMGQGLRVVFILFFTEQYHPAGR